MIAELGIEVNDSGYYTVEEIEQLADACTNDMVSAGLRSVAFNLSKKRNPQRTLGSNLMSHVSEEILKADAKSIDPETGKKKGTRGKNAILFRDQLDTAHSREIYNANGVPEEFLVTEPRPGVRTNDQLPMYNRTHPEGRKVNSKEQRDRNGASYYR